MIATMWTKHVAGKEAKWRQLDVKDCFLIELEETAAKLYRPQREPLSSSSLKPRSRR